MANPITSQDRLPNGRAAAALLAGGIGALAIGLITTLAEASPAISGALAFVKPVGPLSGKTTVAVVVWLIAWAILGRAWSRKDVDLGKVTLWALILLGLGILGTFPPFFELFAAD